MVSIKEFAVLSVVAFSLIVEFAPLARAGTQADCKDVRLDLEGGAFSKIPPYNQTQFYEKKKDAYGFTSIAEVSNEPNISANGENICYAVAVSELTDAHRFSKGDKLEKLSSPLSIALNHKTSHKTIKYQDRGKYGDGDDNYDVIGPGNPVIALLSNQEQPICDQKWFEQYASVIDTKENLEPANSPAGHSVAAFFSGVFDQIEKTNNLKNQLNSKDAQLNEYFKCRTSNETDMSGLLDVARAALAKDDKISQAQIFLKKLCGQHEFKTRIPDPTYYIGKDPQADRDLLDQIERYYGHSQDDWTKATRLLDAKQKNRIAEKINTLLSDPHPIPMGIGYCHELLTGVAPEHCGSADHTSVIVGQHWNGKKCEILIRDSYGLAACKKAPYKCDRGSSWVPRDDVLNASGVGIYWIK